MGNPLTSYEGGQGRTLGDPQSTTPPSLLRRPTYYAAPPTTPPNLLSLTCLQGVAVSVQGNSSDPGRPRATRRAGRQPGPGQASRVAGAGEVVSEVGVGEARWEK